LHSEEAYHKRFLSPGNPKPRTRPSHAQGQLSSFALPRCLGGLRRSVGELRRQINTEAWTPSVHWKMEKVAPRPMQHKNQSVELVHLQTLHWSQQRLLEGRVNQPGMIYQGEVLGDVHRQKCRPWIMTVTLYKQAQCRSHYCALQRGVHHVAPMTARLPQAQYRSDHLLHLIGRRLGVDCVNSSSDTWPDLEQHKVVREHRYQLRHNPKVNPENNSQCIPGIIVAYGPVGGIGVRFPSIKRRALSLEPRPCDGDLHDSGSPLKARNQRWGLNFEKHYTTIRTHSSTEQGCHNGRY
jgi:hypothetical protein